MAQNNALISSIKRLDEVLTKLEKADAQKAEQQSGTDDGAVAKLKAENAAMKKRHDAINTKLTKLISSLEQQLEG